MLISKILLQIITYPFFKLDIFENNNKMLLGMD